MVRSSSKPLCGIVSGYGKQRSFLCVERKGEEGIYILMNQIKVTIKLVNKSATEEGSARRVDRPEALIHESDQGFVCVLTTAFVCAISCWATDSLSVEGSKRKTTIASQSFR